MLPPGHIAAGYLVGELVVHTLGINLPQQQKVQLVLWATFFGFAPDLDMFYAFFKERAFVINKEKIDHRTYITHRPLSWLLLGLIIWVFAPSHNWQLVGMLAWFGGWSHMVLDSIQYGVPWLWPLNTKLYAMCDTGKKLRNPNTHFWKYWFEFVRLYTQHFFLTLVLEAVVIFTALVVFYSTHMK